MSVNLTGNKLESIDKDAFVGLVNLVELNLAHNLLTHISPEAFASLGSLQILHLQFNQMKFLASMVFFSLNQLSYINVSSELPLSTYDLVAFMTDICFADNHLESLFINIVKPGNNIVTFKAASNNNLTAIDSKLVKRLKKSQLIDFTNNSCIDAMFDSTGAVPKHVFYSEVDLKCSSEDY
jgi:hypothetical protein